jgi:hypothetical protein
MIFTKAMNGLAIVDLIISSIAIVVMKIIETPTVGHFLFFYLIVICMHLLNTKAN